MIKWRTMRIVLTASPMLSHLKVRRIMKRMLGMVQTGRKMREKMIEGIWEIVGKRYNMILQKMGKIV
jgi:hypothetical protein